ncbi:MAG: DUF1573 domain-containing protein [Planctomycetota bacterium]
MFDSRFSLVVLLVLLCCAPFATLWAQEPSPDTPGAPRLRLSEYEFDFGTLLQGEMFKHRIKVYNDGRQPLVLESVTPTCSCLTIESFPQSVTPGGEGEIVMTINSKKIRPGKRTPRKFRITSNDPMVPLQEVLFSGEVKVLVRSQPATIELKGVMDKPKEVTITLYPGTGLKYEIIQLQTRYKYAEVVGYELISPGRYRVQLRAGAAKEVGTLKDALDMTCRLSEGKTVTMGMWVHVQHMDRVVISPSGNLVFNNRDTTPLLSDGARPAVKKLLVYSSSPDFTFKIKEVKFEGVPEGVFTATVTPMVDGSRYRVSISLSKYLSESFVQGRVVIVTDDPGHPAHELTLFAKFGLKPKSSR